MKIQSPQQQLASFLAKYSPETASRARSILRRMRALLPGAFQLVYDNYNALVIGFGPTERTSDAPFSIVVYPRWVTLFFLQGAKLPDPHKVLRGAGNKVRSIVLDSAAGLDRPPIRALMETAHARAVGRMDGDTKGRLIIRSISAKQRPRRPT